MQSSNINYNSQYLRKVRFYNLEFSGVKGNALTASAPHATRRRTGWAVCVWGGGGGEKVKSGNNELRLGQVAN